MLSKVTLALGMVLLSANAMAGESQDFQSYLSYAKGKAHMASDAQHNFKPAETFKNYTTHPSETGYYGGDKQEKTALPGAGIAAAKSNDAGKAVDGNFLTRPQYEVNSRDPAITQAKFVQQHSYHIARGISDQYVDCTKKDFCKITYSNQSCVRSKQFDLACHQVLKVTTYKPPVPKNCQHIVVTTGKQSAPPQGKQIASFNIRSWIFSVPYHVYLVPGPDKAKGCYVDGSFHVEHDRNQHGTTTFMGAHDAKYYAHAEAFYRNNHGYANLAVQAGGKTVAHVISNSNLAEHSIELDPKSNTVYTLNGYNTAFDNDDYGDAWSIYWASTPSDPTPTIHTKWVNDCDALTPWIHSNICTQTKNVCTQGKSTKIIGNVPVTEDCWEREQDYFCGAKDDGSCDALKAKGCSELSSTCADKGATQCLHFNEVWQCPQKTCTGHGVQCGANFYCMDGKCNPPQPTQADDKSFDKAVAGMAVANGAAEDVKKQQQNIAIFTGQALQCSKDGLGFADCCNATGWGKDIHLGHCSVQEKKLGKAREDQRAHYVGEKCVTDTPLGCLQHAYVYCVFSSRLAADAQIQGRLEQLGIGMGSGDHPDCRGMSVDEIQRLDFSKMNLSNIYDDINSNRNFPDSGKTQGDINKRIHDFYNRGKTVPGGNK